MPNVYVIKCSLPLPSGIVGEGYLSIHSDNESVKTKKACRHFDTLLSADSYAAALDMQFPSWNHTVEVL